ncbi:histidinol-phosphatase [Ruminococcus sp. Marseille-P6503]|uniref:PHP domain-containing protein n=1 Tax=Ruminococcus sp. Marseille-P6503 TaxID=2364796 RepID=UPI000F53B766|nr:histidinol-phosphatase [Ruminococcus sp. Marseille-P6503]
MKKHLCEAHLHTSEGSACASVSGAEQAERYRALGYDTIFVTDHFFNGNSAVDRSLPWEERINAYCRGFENAQARGKEIGLTVLFGIEYTYGSADFLTYGVDKRWLVSHPELEDNDFFRYAALVHEAGGFLVHAHPFRRAGYLREIRLIPDYTDAVEIINTHNKDGLSNERAKWYARQFDFCVTGGTDNHDVPAGEFCAVCTEKKITTVSDYISAVKNRKLTLETIQFESEMQTAEHI